MLIENVLINCHLPGLRTGHLYQLRRWYQQFYVDVEDFTDDITKRFEFEIDTERAVSHWEAEVAENLAESQRRIDRKPPWPDG